MIALAVAVASIALTIIVYSVLSSDLSGKDSLLKKQEVQIGSLQVLLNKTQVTIGNQSRQITQLDSTVVDHESRIVAIDKQNAMLENQVTSLDITLSNLDAKLENQINALNKTLSDLTLNTTEYSSEIVYLSPGYQDVARARCNPGEIATGGGFDTSDASVIALHNGISGNSGWEVLAKNTGNEQESFIAFAVCASLKG